MPMSASYRLDSTPQENRGEPPDFNVALSPEDWLENRDPQLDKAIALLKTNADSGAPGITPTVVSNGRPDNAGH